MDWEEFRRRNLEKLERAKRSGEVDEDIIQLLDLINSFECYVTTSSCSGRIVLIEVPEIGDKLRARFLGKWHRTVSSEEILRCLRNFESNVWLISDPPILHIACSDLECARNLMRIANDSGFRRCCLISLSRPTVEVTSFERLEAPLAVNGKIVVSEEYVKILAEFANEKLLRGKDKLERFKAKLLSRKSSSRVL